MSQEKDIPATLPNGRVLKGKTPIVILGPNGSGKTRLGRDIARVSGCQTIIAALRNLEIPQDIQSAGREQAHTQLRGEMDRVQSTPWVISNDLRWLMATLLAEDAESATRFRNDVRAGRQSGPPSETTITRLVDFWERTFPGRQIDLSSYRPTVRSTLSGREVTYHATQMSDGERVAVYLAARVLHAPAGLIVVDEPEVHFHSLLARRLWDELESLRDDCRFVYITHDLAFATSRRDAQVIIVRADGQHDLVEPDSGIPEEVIGAVLGAASFSVVAQRVLFCEGTPGKDDVFYRAWFDPNTTAVVAAGGCAEVERCTRAINGKGFVRGVRALGIVDRDYWPDHRIGELASVSVHALPVHELESLLCLPGVFTAIAKHLGKDGPLLWEKAINEAKSRFRPAEINKHALERTKKRVEGNVIGALLRVRADEDRTAVSVKLAEAMTPAAWGMTLENALLEEARALDEALARADPLDFLKLFPGKEVIGAMARALGLSSHEGYRDLVTKALAASLLKTPSQFSPVGGEIAAALEPHLPPRA